MATFFDRGLHLKADDLLNEDVKIYSMRGYERISSCFEFEIKFLCNDDSELECADAVGSPATLTIKYANRTRTIRGIVGSVEFLGSLQSHRYAYAVTLVPRLALLGLSRQNQIHGTSEPETVLDVIEKQVLGTGLKGPAAPGPDRLSSDDCVWAVTAEYPARNLIVQHEESDLDFVSRLAEHYGISYFFEFQEAQTKVVFSDENTGFSTLTKESEDIPFEQHGSLGVSEEPRITRFGYRTTLAPRQVILKDHNYERPDLDLETPHDIAENGAGVVVEYGDHFHTKEEGAFLAKIRAEEIGCRKQVFTGHGDSPCFAAGHVLLVSELVV